MRERIVMRNLNIGVMDRMRSSNAPDKVQSEKSEDEVQCKKTSQEFVLQYVERLTDGN